MATTLYDIRSMAESYVQTPLENQTIILWCNDAQADFGINLNIPATAPITINTTDLKYALPNDYKSLIRFWLKSDYDNGLDVAISPSYRVFGGFFWFARAFRAADTLNVDYYKQLSHFTAMDNAIDVEDRYATLYVSYILSQYYLLPSTITALGDAQARKMYEQQWGRYQTMKRQIVQQYSLGNPDYVVRARW